MASDTLVLVTGASGFTATHVVQQLQEEGYRVRGTVRDLNNEKKIKPLQGLCPTAKHPLELVETDLDDDAGWEEAVTGCTYVIHIASVVPKNAPPNDEAFIRPAVDGTLRILKACENSGTVKRVVQTSSIATATEGHSHEDDYVYTEKDWSNLDAPYIHAYVKSKCMSEKAALEFVQKLPDEKQFELVVLNPGYVVGPVLCGGKVDSMNMPISLMQRERPYLLKVQFPIVDVRDLGKIHIKAMTVPEAAGNRILAGGESLWMKEIAAILREEFQSQGYSVPTTEAPMFLLRFLSYFDKTLAFFLPFMNKTMIIDNSKMTSLLGVELRPAKESFIDMVYSMIEAGHIRKTPQYTPQKK